MRHFLRSRIFMIVSRTISDFCDCIKSYLQLFDTVLRVLPFSRKFLTLGEKFLIQRKKVLFDLQNSSSWQQESRIEARVMEVVLILAQFLTFRRIEHFPLSTSFSPFPCLHSCDSFVLNDSSRTVLGNSSVLEDSSFQNLVMRGTSLP